jgi:di/tricarboxylate transporter
MLLTAAALVLFTRERLPLEFSCLLVLCLLALGFELFPYERDERTLAASDFLASFGNEALIAIVVLLILAKGIEVSGALRPLARILARLWLLNRSMALLATLIATASLSAFMNNTPIVVMLLPLLIGVALRTRIPASKILLPAGFATIIGGMCTTIGTSTNLLVVSIASDLGVPRFAMFDFFLPAAISAGVAILYLWAIAPRMIPERQPLLSRETPRLFESVFEVTDNSPLAGKTFTEIRALMGENIRIRRVQRGKGIELVRLPSLTFRAGDRLQVRGTAEAIKRAQNLFGGGFRKRDLLRSPDHKLVEIVVTRTSPLYRKRFSEARALLLGNLIPIGIYRAGTDGIETLDESHDPVIAAGDILLMQGERREIRKLQDQQRLMILDRTVHVPRSAKAPLALGILIGVVLVAALGWMSILASALCGVALMLFGRCLALEEAWTALDTKLIMVIATSLALGTALTRTGAASFIAMEFVALAQDLPPAAVVAAVLLLTALLTEIVTNNAVAAIGTPIAIAVARELGAPEIPFVLAVLFGANMSYLTPFGYQTNLLVYRAGGYRFSDFFRVGLPLQIIMWLALSLLLPYVYL